nr:DNA-directed DNA polymerase [Tanacetum cinerariifolium]
MRTRSSSNLPVEFPPNPSTSNPKRRNRRRLKQPFILEESPVDTMADQRTMAELLRVPTEGYAEAIVVPPILVEQFELKHSLINMMTSDQYKLDTFYNALNPADQDSLNSVAGGNLLERRTQDVLTIIENKSKFQATPHPAFVKAVEEICVTCGGAHPYYQCLAVGGNTFPDFRDNIQGYVAAAVVNYNQGNFIYRPLGSGSLPSNTIANPKGKLKAITTQSGIVLDGPFVPIPPPFINPEEDERVEETLTDQDLAKDPIHPNIPYPSRMLKQKQQEKDEVQIHKFWKMFKQLHINITLTDALILIPKYQKVLKALLSNKEKLQELANIPLNENCSAVILKKLPERLGDPGKFLISCGFNELDATLCLEKVRDVFILVGKFTFSADFVIVDYESDPRVPLILERPFLWTDRALIDVHGDKMILHDGNDDLQFDIESDLKEIEYLLHHDPIKDIDSILKDSIYQSNLADLHDNLVISMPKMFTDEHALDYSSPPLYNEYYDDLFEVESDNKNVYDDPFDSKGEKIKESKLLIDKLDLPCDFLLPFEYDSILYEDFSKVDALPSTNNEDKSIKVNGVTDDTLRLYLFLNSLTHHATAWFDRLQRNSINTFEQMAKIFLGKYFPTSMVTKLRNEITNFRQRLDESLFEAWERYKLFIDQCPNHNMWSVTQIDMFYNSLTLRHRDTINAAAGGTFMKRRPEECYDLIENMTAHHNDWDTSANEVNQQVKAFTPNCETCGGPRSFFNCPATVGNTQNVYAAGAYQVKRETEATKDTVHPANNESTKDVQPSVILTESPILTSEPVNSPIIEPVASLVSASRPNQRPSIPYPSRFQNQKLRDKANVQREKFFQIFKDLNFNISFVDALILMPKFGPSIKSLLTNKDKLCELAKTPLNEHCSAVLLKKFLEKLGDPGKFLISYDFPGMAKCLALADLGASINLMPLSVWNKLSLPDLSPPCMTLELSDRSIFRPGGVAKDEIFSIDVFQGELTLHVGKEAITFNLDHTSRYSANYSDMTANRIDVIDMACEEYSQKVLGKDKLLVIIVKDLSVEEKTALITVLKSNKRAIAWKLSDIKGIDPEFCTHKILMEEDFEPVVQHQRRVNPKIYDVIKNEVLKLLDAGLIYPIFDSPWVSPLHCVPKKGGFTVVENEENELILTRLVTVFGNSFHSCLSHLEKMLKRGKDTNLYLNWEKSHFMVKEGIVLGHKISKEGIEVDKAKVDVITKLPHPTTVKGIRSFLRHAGFYGSDFAIGVVLGQRQDKHFRPIHYASKTMTEAKSNYTTTEKEMLAMVYAFEKFRSYLIMNTSIVYTDHSALKYLFAKKDSKVRFLRWVLLLQEFTFKVIDTKGAENLAADHLSD